MAAQKIGYANKQSGSLWTSSNANEVKDVVNSHAENIDSLSGSLATSRQDIADLQTDIQEKADASDVEAALAAKANASDVTAALGLKADKTERMQMTDTTARIDPNKLYVWGSVAALNITLTPGTAGVVNEYMLQFTAASDNFTLTLSDTVRWAVEPEFQAGHTYYVSIQDGLGLCAGWEAAAS